MSKPVERVFVVGASGDIGSGVVRGLVKKRIETTAFVRNEEKAKDLFQNEIQSGHLKFVVGDYSSIDVYRKAIEGHSRLFLLVHVDGNRPTSMREIKGQFAQIAYEKGVRQIVDLSSFTVRMCGKQGMIGYLHTTSEEILWKLADENGDQRSLVVLRPGGFMTNHFMADALHIKKANKIVSSAPPTAATTWIDTRDISDCAVVILSESIEKHDRCVYEMGSQRLTNEERANIFSEVLGRRITYEQQPTEALYKSFIGFGMAHSLVYDILSLGFDYHTGAETPQLCVLINRPLYTLQDWIKENIKAFQ